MENTDRLLRDLGQGLPFEVDWQAYQREVLRRMTASEDRRRTSPWRFVLAGMAAGVAATLLLSLPFRREKSAPIPNITAASSEVASIKSTGAMPLIYSSRTIHAVENSPRTASQPAEKLAAFVQKTGSGEIRFNGFSTGDSKVAEFIAITKPARKQRVN